MYDGHLFEEKPSQTQAFIYRKFLNDIAETVQYQFLFLWVKVFIFCIYILQNFKKSTLPVWPPVFD